MLKAPMHAPRTASAHPRWRSTLASTSYGFGFSRPLIALLSSYWFLHLFRRGGCQVGAGSSSRLLVSFGIEPGLEPFKL